MIPNVVDVVGRFHVASLHPPCLRSLQGHQDNKTRTLPQWSRHALGNTAVKISLARDDPKTKQRLNRLQVGKVFRAHVHEVKDHLVNHRAVKEVQCLAAPKPEPHHGRFQRSKVFGATFNLQGSRLMSHRQVRAPPEVQKASKVHWVSHHRAGIQWIHFHRANTKEAKARKVNKKPEN